MSTTIKLPRVRRYPPPLSQEEIQRRSQIEMQKKGAMNHFLALKNAEYSKIVSESDRAIFSVLKTPPKIKKDEAWRIALCFVYDFLKENNLQQSTDVFLRESMKNSNDLNKMFKKPNRTEYFVKMLLPAARTREDFDERLAAFLKQYTLHPPPNEQYEEEEFMVEEEENFEYIYEEEDQ